MAWATGFGGEPLPSVGSRSRSVGLSSFFAVSNKREVAGQNVFLLDRPAFEGLRPDADLRLLVGLEAGAGGHEVAEDHVFLQAHQRVDLAGQGGLGQAPWSSPGSWRPR